MADDDYDIPWMTDRTGAVILAAVDGDTDRIVSLLGEIGKRYGDQGGYGLCYALAEAIALMGDFDRGGCGFHGFSVVHLERGLIAPEDVDPTSRPVMVAMRFLTAHLNDDTEQRLALFYAPETPEDAALLPVGLVTLVGAYGRHKLEQNGGGT